MENHSGGCYAIPTIENFRDKFHNMCIQAHRDAEMEWLQLQYCINGEEVEMEMWDWKDD
jgi:hypothetical protein